METNLTKTQKQLEALASQAAAGDEATEAQLAARVAALHASADVSGWPTIGSVLFATLEALAEAPDRASSALRRLAPALVDAITAHPESLGLPYHFRPAKSLGPAGIAVLAGAIDRGLTATSRATIDSLRGGNPMSSAAFKVAVDALDRLFEYADHEAKVAVALSSLPWTDERLWLLFRILAGGYGGPFEGKWQSSVAIAALGAVAAATEHLAGDGARKLRALLVRAEILPRSAVKGDKPPKLPRALPLDVAGALALLDAFQLSTADVEAKPPARKAAIESLAKKVGRRLPRELAALLGAHASIGDREFGPPARMNDLCADLRATIREHESEDDSSPTGKGEIDVRTFDPLKNGIPLGTDVCGDLYFLATGAKSEAGLAPVIRYHHDQCLVATIAASSLGEYVALLFARVYARREGLEVPLRKLEERRRKIASF